MIVTDCCIRTKNIHKLKRPDNIIQCAHINIGDSPLRLYPEWSHRQCGGQVF